MASQRTIIRLAAFCAALSLSAGASAVELYGTNFSGLGTFYGVNQSNGDLTSIGSTGTTLGDLTSNPAAGVVWGVNIGTNTLYTVNVATGAATAGPTITGTAALPGSNTGLPIVSLAYDPVTSMLYGNTAVNFGGATVDTLYRIDPVTGAATAIGTNIGFTSVFALGFQSGRLFGIADSFSNKDVTGAPADTLIGIDTATGLGTRIADLPAGDYFDLAARPGDNVVFVANFATSSLYTINTGTGALTLVGDYGLPENIVGLAFVGEIPEPSTYLLMLSGLLGLGWMARRRAG